MKVTKPEEAAARCPARDARAKMVDECFPGLPATVRTFLIEHPVLFEFLLRLEHGLARGELTSSELSRLGESWCEEHPARRAAVIYLLRDFRQSELDLGLPRPNVSEVVRKSRRRKRRLG